MLDVLQLHPESVELELVVHSAAVVVHAVLAAAQVAGAVAAQAGLRVGEEGPFGQGRCFPVAQADAVTQDEQLSDAGFFLRDRLQPQGDAIDGPSDGDGAAVGAYPGGYLHGGHQDGGLGGAVGVDDPGVGKALGQRVAQSVGEHLAAGQKLRELRQGLHAKVAGLHAQFGEGGGGDPEGEAGFL